MVRQFRLGMLSFLHLRLKSSREIYLPAYHSHRALISDSFTLPCRDRAYCHSHPPSPGTDDATWRGDIRVFSPNYQEKSVAAMMDELDPLDEPLSPLTDE